MGKTYCLRFHGVCPGHGPTDHSQEPELRDLDSGSV